MFSDFSATFLAHIQHSTMLYYGAAFISHTLYNFVIGITIVGIDI